MITPENHEAVRFVQKIFRQICDLTFPPSLANHSIVSYYVDLPPKKPESKKPMATNHLSKILLITLVSAVAQPALAKDPHKIQPKDLPRVFTPTRVEPDRPIYPWKRNIMATVFWAGEQPTANNPTPNCASSWDTKWAINFGGYDNPNPAHRKGFRPASFVPNLNPFYVALPYNDVASWRSHKPEASKVIPWFHRSYRGPGASVCKGRWLAIRHNGKTAYAQWEDCGPFNTTDWRYVFGSARPKTNGNGGAGIDLSPAVRDYLGMKGNVRLDWRFVEVSEVPSGPWRNWGRNNHFVKLREMESDEMSRRISRFRGQDTDAWLTEKPNPRG